jgi:methyl-accepting chemotaxis protein
VVKSFEGKKSKYKALSTRHLFSFEMNPHEPLFWLVIITAIIALSFLMIAAAMIAMATFVNRAVKSVNRLEERLEPLMTRATAISEQGTAIAVQGRQIAEQFNVMSGHLSTATMNLAESTALIKEEVRGIMALADETAEVAHEKVHLVSRAIDTTHERVMDTTEFIQRKVIEPARELAAILAGLRRGLEVLVAPAPSPVNRSYGDEEMFIG